MHFSDCQQKGSLTGLLRKKSRSLQLEKYAQKEKKASTADHDSHYRLVVCFRPDANPDNILLFIQTCDCTSLCIRDGAEHPSTSRMVNNAPLDSS